MLNWALCHVAVIKWYWLLLIPHIVDSVILVLSPQGPCFLKTIPLAACWAALMWLTVYLSNNSENRLVKDVLLQPKKKIPKSETLRFHYSQLFPYDRLILWVLFEISRGFTETWNVCNWIKDDSLPVIICASLWSKVVAHLEYKWIHLRKCQ